MKAYVAVTLAEVPHLDQRAVEETLKSVPPWQREMRRTGIPTFGTGAIYPVPLQDITVTPFDIPKYWVKAYGFDVGWNVNAVVFGALDSASDTLFIYDEIYKAKCEPDVLVAAINSRGSWLPGVIDPASAGSGQRDGKRLIDDYRARGLDVRPADNSVVAGLTRVWERLSQGRLKIFGSCQKLLGEYPLYRRNEKGDIVESPDHALDALRYLCMSGLQRAMAEPNTRPGHKPWYHQNFNEVWAG